VLTINCFLFETQDAPVVLLEKVKNYESVLENLLKFELHLKDDSAINPLIKTWDDPNEDLTEEGMKNKAKNGLFSLFDLFSLYFPQPY